MTPHLEELTISIDMDNTELLITKEYIPAASSCNGRYSPPIDHLLTGTDSLDLGDFNAHHLLWHSGTIDTRGNQLVDSVSISSFAVLNTDSPTRLPGKANPSSPDVSLASASLYHLVQLANTHNHELRPSAHPYRITTATSFPARHRTYIKLKNWTGHRHLPTDCQRDEKLFRATLLKAASHHIPTGRRKLYMQQVPAEILAKLEEQDDLCKQDLASHRLSTMNDEINKRHILQTVELSQRTQAAVQIVSNLPNGGLRFTVFGHAGHADLLDGCCSQKRVMSRPIQFRQL